MSLSIGAQAFLLELGMDGDGMNAYSAVKLIEKMGLDPDEVLEEVSRRDMVMSVRGESALDESIYLSLEGKNHLQGVAEILRNQYWYNQ